MISAIGGAGGIGKTWLALHWAHEHVDRFPDGQLFVDLRGFSPDGKPMPPAVAVRGFLDALGADPDRLPIDLHAQAALFRSLIAGRRMLVVLDNAADTDQVIPLLPGDITCAVLVTSRNELPTLITRYGARHLYLGVLGETEARSMLTARLGSVRVESEPTAVDELIEVCGGFPLAMSIIAARAQANPQIQLALIAAELREARLEAFDAGEPMANLSAVFSWSYRTLTGQHAKAFGLLGIAPGPDIALPAAASLLGLPRSETATVLRHLQQASLLNREATGRYQMHDLIRQFAVECAHRDITYADQSASLRRVVDFYLHTAFTADRLLHPQRPPIQLAPPEPGCATESLPDTSAAIAWYDAEHPCLLAAQHTAAALNQHQTVWQLAWTLANFHDRRGHRRDQLAVWKAALAAADYLDDPAVLTRIHRHLGRAYADMGRHDDAINHLQQSLAIDERNEDQLAQAHTHRALAWTWETHGDIRQALEHETHALRLFSALDNEAWQAISLNSVGWRAARLGDYDQARQHCRAALKLHRRHHNKAGEASTLDSLGYINDHTGHHSEAVRNYQQSLILLRDVGYTAEIPNTLDKLGHAHNALGEHEQARTVWREALDSYQAQHRPEDAERVQRQLDALDQRTTR